MTLQSFKNAVRFNATTSSTATFGVGSAPTGYITPENALVTEGKSYRYYAQSSDGAIFEMGNGIYSIISHTLTRVTIEFNSNNDTSPVNFPTLPIVDMFASVASTLEPPPTVLYSAQSLTAAQQQQARSNIGYGSLINCFRNGTIDVWQRPSPMTLIVGSSYTADGWIVSYLGSGGVVSLVNNARTGANTAYAIKMAGSVGCTDITIEQRIESLIAARLAGKTVTVQAQLTNNTGASITPTLAVNRPTIKDVWGAETAEFAAVNLQPCPNGVNTQIAYTFALSTSANIGVDILFDFGNNFSTTGKSVTITELDIQVTPNLPIGICAVPPVPQLRDAMYEEMFCYRYYYVSPSTSFGYPSPAVGGYAFLQIYPFPVAMWNVPTASTNYGGQINLTAANQVSVTILCVTDQVVATAAGNVTWFSVTTATAEL